MFHCQTNKFAGGVGYTEFVCSQTGMQGQKYCSCKLLCGGKVKMNENSCALMGREDKSLKES